MSVSQFPSTEMQTQPLGAWFGWLHMTKGKQALKDWDTPGPGSSPHLAW